MTWAHTTNLGHRHQDAICFSSHLAYLSITFSNQ